MKECFDVTGMSCAACQVRVEKSVRKLDGVKDVNVNLLKNSMEVVFDEGMISEDGIVTAVEKAGYGAIPRREEEKAAAKTAAEEILAEWEAGDATEESFAELANAKSDDGDGTTGGLYENISPDSNYVDAFKDWALDDHQPGDTGIIETQYGYHVMYYVGQTDYTYRDYQIETQLRDEDVTAWYTETVDAVTVTEGDTSYIRKDLVLNAAN